jgi:non-ribosomal peptide synthetase component F
VAGGNRGIKYAEEQLRVHDVYADALAGAHDADTSRRHLAMTRREKWQAEEAYTDAELEFIAAKRGDNPDMSQTAFDKYVKGEIHKNPDLRRMRAALADLNLELDATEAAIRRSQNQVDTAHSRMTELGGYLNYLAAIKAASAPAGQTENWPPDSALPN